MRGLALVLLTALAAGADAETEAELLERWSDAGPDERRRLSVLLERMDRARRYSSARPVLVEFDGRTFTLAELFQTYLDGALRTPPRPESERDPGLQEIHRGALSALAALRSVYAPPRPVRPGTLNLLLGYASRALTAPALTPGVRLRFFTEAIRNVRQLDGRVKPDERTHWLVKHRLLPPLLAVARRTADDDTVRETVAEAASLLYMPSILDEAAQAQLAPLMSGIHSRDVLLRFYKEGLLDELGRIALARNVAAQTRDDPAFAAGAAPLMLELLTDPQLPARDRGALLDAVLDRLAGIELMQGTALDLLAAGFGGPPGDDLEAYRARRKQQPAGVALPVGQRRFRFLSVVLLQERKNAPPAIARVVRADLRHFEPLHAGARGTRRFIGTLVPDRAGRHADLLGPPPGLTGTRDNRLLRRRLDLERISIRSFGTRGEEIELCVTLPEDGTEPVPKAAHLGHVLALIAARIERATAPDERRELVRLLVRIDTDHARELALRHATGAAAIELLPLAERGDARAARRLVACARGLDLADRERVLQAALAAGAPEPLDAVRKLCRDRDVALAAVAADALLAVPDASGVKALLEHENKYARLVGVSLALRLTPLAGGLRVVPGEHADLEQIARVAEGAFTKEDGPAWARLGQWLAVALREPEKVRTLRRQHKPLYVGRRRVLPYEFAGAWTRGIGKGKAPELWAGLIVFLLDPSDPGRGILERDLAPLLDALEARARKDEALRRTWIDALVVLAGVQYGMEKNVALLDLAHARLARIAGASAPADARRKAGLLWPLWAARGEKE